MDKDKLTNVPLGRTAEIAMAVLTVLQDFPPHLQAAAVGLVFTAICNTFKTDPVEVIQVLRRMHDDANMRVSVEGNAVKAYVEGELVEAADAGKEANEQNRAKAERKLELLNELDERNKQRIWVPGSVSSKDGSGRRWDE